MCLRSCVNNRVSVENTETNSDSRPVMLIMRSGGAVVLNHLFGTRWEASGTILSPVFSTTEEIKVQG